MGFNSGFKELRKKTSYTDTEKTGLI